MKDSGFKIISALIILLFIFSPLSAVDLEQIANVAHGDIGDGNYLNDVNGTVFDGASLNDGNDTSNIVDKDININDTAAYVDNDEKNSGNADCLSLNGSVSCQNIDNRDIDLNVKVDDVYRGQTPILVITQSIVWPHNVSVSLTGSNYSVIFNCNIINREKCFELPDDLPVDTYDVKVYYKGDSYWKPSAAKCSFSVNDDAKVNPNINVFVDDILISEHPVIKIKANESLNCYVKFAINDSIGTVYRSEGNIRDGEMDYTINNHWPQGNYSAVVTFNGDDRFIATNASTNFHIYDRFDRFDPGLSVSVDDVVVGMRPVVKVSANESLNCDVKLDVLCNNSSYVYSDNLELVNGRASIVVNEAARQGNYSAIVTFDGNDIFSPSVKSANFSVNKFVPPLRVDGGDVPVGEKTVDKLGANGFLNGDMKLKAMYDDLFVDKDKLKFVNDVRDLTANDYLAVTRSFALVMYDGDDISM